MPAVRSKSRVGEGVSIPMTKRIVPLANGASAMELNIDLGAAPVPDRRYLADMAEVAVDGDTVRLMFAQKKVSGGLRSLVIVTMTSDAINNVIKTIRAFYPTVIDLANRNGIKPRELSTISEEPLHTVSLVANLVAMAQAGRESCVDFYYMSPWVVKSIRTDQVGDVSVDPILRVDISTALLLPMLTKLLEIQSTLPGDVQ